MDFLALSTNVRRRDPGESCELVVGHPREEIEERGQVMVNDVRHGAAGAYQRSAPTRVGFSGGMGWDGSGWAGLIVGSKRRSTLAVCK